MRLKFLILLGFVAIHFCFSQTKPTITLSQTRGCVPFTDTLKIKNNGFCNTVNPNFIIYLPSEVVTSNDTTFSKDLLITSTGITNITITCTFGTVADLGIFSIIGLTNSTPEFSISSCQGDTATVNLKNQIYDQYQIDWGDGSTSLIGRNVTPKHKYADEITKSITVTGIYAYTVSGQGLVTSCRNDSVASATPYSILTSPTLFQLALENYASNGGQATISVLTDQKLKYKVYQKTFGGTYSTTPIDTILNVINGANNFTKTVTVGGLNTIDNTYCFKIESFDDCGHISPATTPDKSPNALCSLPIAGSASISGNNIITGGYYNPSYFYALSVNGVTVDSGLIILSSKLLYTDVNILCGFFYNYRASAFTKSTGIDQLSISAPLPLLSIKPSNQSPPSGFLASYGKTDQKLTLSWNPVTFAGVVSYDIYAEGSPNKLVGSVSGVTTFIAPKPTSKCYLINTSSPCGNSNSVRACPPFLTAQKDNLEQNSAQWEAAVTGDNSTIVNYDLEFYAQGGGVVPYFVEKNSANPYTHVLATQGRITDTTSQVIVYRVIGYLFDGTEVRSDFVSVKQDLRIFIPSAFSPNKDGDNDIYIPKGLFWYTFELSIFNRWGQNVFYSTNKREGWDGGQFNPDLYHYVMKVTDQFGDEIVKNGTFQLIR